MSAEDLQNSKTDWARVDALADAEIDTSEGLLEEDFFRRAELRSPTKERRTTVTLKVDTSVLAWFQMQDDYETRVNAALKLYADAHKEVALNVTAALVEVTSDILSVAGLEPLILTAFELVAARYST